VLALLASLLRSAGACAAVAPARPAAQSPGTTLAAQTTGLDPSSRRNLWNVVRANKGGRSIILTTHSMEEAETLCDRLGIFVDGQLVCIANPTEITSRYAGFLVFSISVPIEQDDRAQAVVLAMAPGAVLTYSQRDA
jgi:ABC-type multidrug transport system ATPase subunit